MFRTKAYSSLGTTTNKRLQLLLGLIPGIRVAGLCRVRGQLMNKELSICWDTTKLRLDQTGDGRIVIAPLFGRDSTNDDVQSIA
jgi:hypothetical protein